MCNQSKPQSDARTLTQIITPDEAASLVGLSGRTIRRLCADGKIPNCAQLGRQWRINRASLLQLFGIIE